MKRANAASAKGSPKSSATKHGNTAKQSNLASPSKHGESSTQKAGHTSSSIKASPTTTSEETGYWVMISKRGTSLETFKKFTSELDGSKGELDDLGYLKSQIYVTKLSPIQAKDIQKKYDFIDYLAKNEFDTNRNYDNEFFRAHVRTRDINFPNQELNGSAHTWDSSFTRESPRDHILPRQLVEDSSAPAWKKMLSAPRRDITGGNEDPTHDPIFSADNSGGRGTTIYILDDGFDLSIVVPVRPSLLLRQCPNDSRIFKRELAG